MRASARHRVAKEMAARGEQNESGPRRNSTGGMKAGFRAQPCRLPQYDIATGDRLAAILLLYFTSSQLAPLKRCSCMSVSYTHLRAHETGRNLVCRLLLE